MVGNSQADRIGVAAFWCFGCDAAILYCGTFCIEKSNSFCRDSSNVTIFNGDIGMIISGFTVLSFIACACKVSTNTAGTLNRTVFYGDIFTWRTIAKLFTKTVKAVVGLDRSICNCSSTQVLEHLPCALRVQLLTTTLLQEMSSIPCPL